MVEDGNQSDTGEIMDLANQEQQANCSENEEEEGARLSLQGYKNNNSKLRHRSSPDCSIGGTLSVTTGVTVTSGVTTHSDKSALLRATAGLVSSCSNVSTTAACG